MGFRKRKGVFTKQATRYSFSPRRNAKRRNPTRTKRRIRHPLRLAIIILVLLALIVGGFFGVHYLVEKGKAKKVESERTTMIEKVSEGIAAIVNARKNDPLLLLVNASNPLPENYSFDASALDNGLYIDSRAYDDFMDMLGAAYEAGLTPEVTSAYRHPDLQRELFQEQVDSYLNQGYDEEDARTLASQSVALPGTSEHECALAVDIIDPSFEKLVDAQADTEVQKWFIEHSWEYGFILRYPSEKVDITGIKYEPWHYRYVGKENAKAMHDKNLCLEEYLGIATP